MPKKIIIKLQKHLDEKNLSLRELARRSGTYHRVLSRWTTRPIESINLQLLANVYEALELNDLRDLLDVVDVPQEEL